MSHMTTFSIVLCLSNSLAVEPSPPPITNTVLGLNKKYPFQFNNHKLHNFNNMRTAIYMKKKIKISTLGDVEVVDEQEIHGR